MKEELTVMNKNDDKVREILMEEPIPKELEPENISKMLSEKVPSRKRKSIMLTASKITAGAAACAVICATAVHFAEQSDELKEKPITSHIEIKDDKTKHSAVVKPNAEEHEDDDNNVISPAEENKNSNVSELVNTAKDYSEVFNVYKENAVEHDYYYTDNDDVETAVEESNDGVKNETVVSPSSKPAVGINNSSEPQHSETYNQEEGVLEADIVKTDGKHIYYLYRDYDGDRLTSAINIAKADDGKFLSHSKLTLDDVSVKEAFGDDLNIDENTVSMYVKDIYLYNDMLITIGNIGVYTNGMVNVEIDGNEVKPIYNDRYKQATFVSAYTTGSDPKHIATYYQEGFSSDVRISPDGYMYLVSTYNTGNVYYCDDENDLAQFVPMWGMANETEYAKPNQIILPEEELEEKCSYSSTVVGSIDLNKKGSVKPVEMKVVMGCAGNVYCSADNLYTASGWNDTELTRFSISKGKITPAAAGKVEGRVRDQFSMSENDKYFRIATTKDTTKDTERTHIWYDTDGKRHTEKVVSTTREKRDNRVYVLDMKLNEVGRIDDFGIDEEIKSVNFSGDTAYVVTYEQTDPLFAIDLSDPKNPKIMDEFKILGYSTYMQQWADGELLGFGRAADEDGIEYGYKLTMFDNSDPDDLDALDTYEISGSDHEWVYSEASSERKALFIAPEKNIIGVPFFKNSFDTEDVRKSSKSSGFMFFSFNNGKFRHIGTLDREDEKISGETGIFRRAVYIGDKLYILSGSSFISSSADKIEKLDSVEF